MRTCYAGRVSLLSLEFCFKEQIQGVLGQRRPRNDCCDWDQLSKSSANNFDKTEETDYPTTRSNKNPHTFPPHRTTVKTSLVCIEQSCKALLQTLNQSCSIWVQQQGRNTDKVEHCEEIPIFSWYWLKRAKWVCQADRAMKDNHHVSESNYILQMCPLPYSMELWVEIVRLYCIRLGMA